MIRGLALVVLGLFSLLEAPALFLGMVAGFTWATKLALLWAVG